MKRTVLISAMLLSCMLLGCGSRESKTTDAEVKAEEAQEEMIEEQTEEQPAEESPENPIVVQTALESESAADSHIDFGELQKENEDIFGWIYIPGTGIDLPVLQSGVSDDFYESHNAAGDSDDAGALYIEMANLMDMCDFNTVIHGKTAESGSSGLFHELYDYADPDFLKQHGTVYFYIEGNLLTYQIFAAYERENDSLIRTYDFGYISGCQEFLDDLYTREVGKNILEGWENGVTPYHFLITLTTSLGEDADRQFVVVAALIEDAAGTIDRPYME